MLGLSRLLIISAVAVVLALGIVFISIAALGGPGWASSLALGYLKEAARVGDCALARATPLGPSDEDFQVYNAAYEAFFSKAATRPPIYLVTAWPNEVRPVPLGCFGAGDPAVDIVRNFGDRNETQWGLARRFQLEPEVNTLEPIQFVRRALEGEDIERVEFSRVGYDATHSRALVYLAHHCVLCSGGYYAVVARDKQGHWSVVDYCVEWQS